MESLQNPIIATRWIEILLAWALILQSIELLALRETLSESNGLWKWTFIKKDFLIFPNWIQNLASHFLKPHGFETMNLIRIVLCIILLFDLSSTSKPFLIALLLLSQALCAWRWRGTFNGGSDFMSLLVLVVIFLSQLRPQSEKWQSGALIYLALQTAASYFISGIVKVQHQNWRNGQALLGFMNLAIYKQQNQQLPFSDHFSNQFSSSKGKWIRVLFFWLILIFELTFPLVFLSPKYCFGGLILALSFHGINVIVFGLNRFFWAWLAAYPAMIFCSFWVQNHLN